MRVNQIGVFSVVVSIRTIFLLKIIIYIIIIVDVVVGVGVVGSDVIHVTFFIIDNN